MKIYKSKVAPLFLMARIEVELVVTERANHARDMLQDMDLTMKDYDGVACVGGDGMFAELYNGILVRTQKEQGVDWRSPDSKLSQPTISVGVIPAGSTDAVAFGVTGTNDPVTSTIHIIFGKRVDIDVSAIHNNERDQSQNQLIRYATTLLGYGFFGDVLVDSETNRWMGPKRYDWAGFKKILGHRLYNGEIKVYASTEDGSPRDTTLCHSNCPQCAKSALRAKYGMSKMGKELEVEDGHGSQCSQSSFVTIKGRFLAINAITMACRCDKAKKGMSPAAHLGNGCADLIIVSDCSRFNYLRYLMRTGFLSKSPVRLDFSRFWLEF